MVVNFAAVQDFLFRNIQRSEWEPLFNFINQRKIRIENLAEARQGPRAAAPAIDFGLGEDLDAGLRAARAEAGGLVPLQHVSLLDVLLLQACTATCFVTTCFGCKLQHLCWL